MHRCDEKVSTTSGIMSLSVICKIQKMPWLQRNITPSTHVKSNEKTEETMSKPLSQKAKAGQNAPEKKDRKKQSKSKRSSTAGSLNNDFKYKGNARTEGEEQKNIPAGKSGIKTSESSLPLPKHGNAWNLEKNAAESLFPNADSTTVELSEEDQVEIAIKESIETANLEKWAKDRLPDDVIEKSTEESESQWDQVQRNLPTPEPESKISDRNNNSGVLSVENLTPAIAPYFIDKYGRIDGCTEKRLFMGKGARFKEQQVITQLKQQQVEIVDLLPKLQNFTPYSSGTSVAISNASAQVSSKKDDAINSQASSENHTETPTDVMEEACGYSQDLSYNAQEFNSQSEVEDSYFNGNVDPSMNEKKNEPMGLMKKLSSQSFALPKEEITSFSSGHVPTSSETGFASSQLHFRNEPGALVHSSEAFSIQTKQNSSIPGQTSGQVKRNSYIPEQPPTQSRQDSTRVGRPIVAGANCYNHQQKRCQNFGISLNRGGYHDANPRDNNFKKHREHHGQYNKSSRSDKNFGRTHEGGNGNDYGVQKDDRYFGRSQGDTHNYRNAKYEQNPHKYGQQNRYKWETGQNRDVRRLSTADQFLQKSDDQNRDLHGKSGDDRSSCKTDGEQKCDNHKFSTTDTNPHKPIGGSTKNDNINDHYAHSQIEKTPPVPFQKSNMNASPKQNPHVLPSDVATNDFTQNFENSSVQNKLEDCNDTSSNTSEVPDVSNFASRSSVPPPNSFFVAPTPGYSETSDAAGLEAALQQSPSPYETPPGFQSLERSAVASCACSTPITSFQARYANLQLTDPLLFRLLHQKMTSNLCRPMKFSAQPENRSDNSGNRKEHGRCPNCSCNSPSSRNFDQESTNPNETNCCSEEEACAPFQPINPYLRNSVASQLLQSLQIGHDENNACAASNMQHPNIPLFQNWQAAMTYGDFAANNVPSMMNLCQQVPQCSGFSSLPPENLPWDVQPQLMSEYQIPNLPGFLNQRTINMYGHHEALMPMPFHQHNYDTNISAKCQSNIGQSNPGSYREAEHYQTVASRGVDLNNQQSTEENARAFPVGMGPRKNPPFPRVPIRGRGRSSMPRRN